MHVNENKIEFLFRKYFNPLFLEKHRMKSLKWLPTALSVHKMI